MKSELIWKIRHGAIFLHGYLYPENKYKFIKESTIDEKKNKYRLQGMIMI